jgi:hypothetical protein
VIVGMMRGSSFAHFLRALLPPELVSLLRPWLVGVGNNPDAISLVVCANGGSWYAMPFRIKPERGQGPENDAEPSMKQICDVLHDDEEGSNFANKSGVLRP